MTSYLSALALLKTSYDQHGATYLDYMTPFVGDTIRAAAGDQISATELRAALIDRYGLEVPSGVVNTLVRRLTKLGYGVRSHGHFLPNKTKLAEAFDLDQKRAEAHATIQTLAASFVDFARTHTGDDLSIQQATEALTRYADINGLPILRKAYRHEGLSTSLSLNETEYITSLFVIHAFEGKRPEKEMLVMLAKGSKLASVLYLPDPGTASRKISGLTAFFDTPTLLSALGYQGSKQERPAREIITLAYQSGLTVAAFDHTLDEMESVLSAVGERINRGGNTVRSPWGVETHFLEHGYNASDIQLLAGSLKEDLRSLRVQVFERPDARVEWSVDESALEKKLLAAVRYTRREPMLHDLDALTATYRKRRARLKRNFEDCIAVFVTSNRPLVNASREFFQSQYGNHWPPAVTEDEFATLLWLKQPLAAPDLPSHRVLADAYAALEPGFIKWESFLTEAETLRDNNKISEDDYYLLRYTSYAKDALMQETMGQNVGVTAETAQQIIERVQESIRTPVQEEADRRATELEELRDHAKRLEVSLRRDLKKVECERDQARVDSATARQQLESGRQHARNKAQRWGSRCRWVAVAIAILVIFLGTYFSAPTELGLPPDRLPSIARWIARASVLSLAFFAVLNLVFDWRVLHLARKLDIWVSTRLERSYLPDE